MRIIKFLEYLELEKRYSPLTVKWYKEDLGVFSNYLESEFNIQDLSLVEFSQLRSFVVFLSNKEIAESSINRKISAVKSFYKFLVKIGDIEINPTSELKNLKIKKKILLPYTLSEVEQIYDYFKENNYQEDFDLFTQYLIFEILYKTGIRRAELISLTNKSIDIEAKVLKVLGKRGKERLIPLLEEVMQSVDAYDTSKLQLGISTMNLLCDKEGERLSENYVYSVINNLMGLVTTKTKKSPHMLRHTFATHLLNNGAEINSVKEILGHSSLMSTQVYTHNDIEELKKVFSNTHPFAKK